MELALHQPPDPGNGSPVAKCVRVEKIVRKSAPVLKSFVRPMDRHSISTWVHETNTTEAMRTTILTLALALMTSAAATAQDTKSTPSSPMQADKHACIMADAGTWTDLGLDATQVTKVKAIQANCQKEHDSAKAAGTKYEGASKYETELKAVLTPDQYTKWAQWCDANKAMNTKKPMTK